MNICAIVETRKLPNIRAIVENHVRYSGFEPMVFHGHDNAQFIQNELIGLKCFFINIGINELSAVGYNKLLTSNFFWGCIPCENVLIFQHDSLLLRYGIEEFMEDGADWYGAPWIFQEHGGNGGLSLRRKSTMIKVIDNYTYNLSIDPNEDCWFCNHIEKVGGKLGTREMCSRFSCETIIKLGTLGYHDIEQYLSKEDCEKIKNQYNGSGVK